MSYPPYGQNQPPQGGYPPPQQPRPGGYPPPQPPQNPYGAPPPNPYGAPRPQPQQPPRPNNPYGGQPGPYGAPQPPRPNNPYASPPQQPPYGGGGPGGPGGPFGGPGAPGGPTGPGGPRRSKRGMWVAVLTVLGLLVVGGVVIGLENHKKKTEAGGSIDAGSMGFGGAASSGGTSWAPPSWATSKNDLGHADPKTVVTGTVWFAQAKPQDLASYALQAATPGNANYHKFLTPDQTGSTFATHADAATVVDQWVTSAGMKVLNKDEQSMTVSTTVAKVEQTLKIKIDRFKHNGKVYLSTTSQPQYPSNIGDYVASVTGLVTSSPVDAPHVFKTADDPNCSRYFGQRKAQAPAGPTGATPAQFLCGYTAGQLRSAYGAAGSGLTGKGVTIAIVDAFASPTIEHDVNRWSQEMGLPELQPGQFKQVLPESYDPQSTASLAQGWWGEETLDVEAVHAIAPDAKIVYYAAKSPSTDEFFNVFEKIISTRSADIVSNSWGSPEGSGDQANYQAGLQLFQRAAAEGISFNFSTGDDGDYTQTDSNAEPSPFSSYPSGDPWVTAVGGTTLGIGSSGQYQWETGWGNVLYPQSGSGWDTAGAKFHDGGGGGNSHVFNQPGYQKGVVPGDLASVATGSATREQPDVAMLANPLTGFQVGQSVGTAHAVQASDGGVNFTQTGAKWTLETTGGTSLACPLFSAMEALAQEGSGSPLGLANPVLYSLHGTDVFHDAVHEPAALGGHAPSVLAGDSNGNPLLVDLDEDTSLKTASGYDATTGLGSPTDKFLTWFKDHPNGQ